MVVVGGFYITWQSLEINRENSDVTNRATLTSLNLAENNQIEERFYKDVGALNSPNLYLRLGAIYSLESIGRRAPDTYYWKVVEILQSYIKENRQIKNSAQSLSKPISKDVDSIINFFKEGFYSVRHSASDNIDLSNCDLQDVNFSGINLAFSNFTNSNLSHAAFSNSEISNANFSSSNLNHTEFLNANLQGADFSYAHINHTDFMTSNLYGAQFFGADFQGHNEFHDAVLYNTDFCRDYDVYNDVANHVCSKNLTCNQLIGAKISDLTRLPDKLFCDSTKIDKDPIHDEAKKLIKAVQAGDIKKLYSNEFSHVMTGGISYVPYNKMKNAH